MMKAPMKRAKVWPDVCQVVDPDTGEVTKVHTGRYEHKKEDLRPGERVRMCRIMADRYLDQLAFAAGEGVQVLKAIRDEALRPYRIWERRQPWHGRERPGRQPAPGHRQPRAGSDAGSPPAEH